MRGLLLGLLMTVQVMCPHCDTEHQLLQYGVVDSTAGNTAVINIDGENHNWYLEDWYLEAGDRIVILDCQIVEVIEN